MFILAWVAGAKRGGGGRKSPIPPFPLPPFLMQVLFMIGVSPGNGLPNKRRKSAEDEVAYCSSASLGYRGF